MVYREQYRDPRQLAEVIRMKTRLDTHKIIKGLALELIDSAHGDMRELYRYFDQVYDELYHSLLFRQLSLRGETQELLEVLATPLFRKTKIEQLDAIKKYIRNNSNS